MANVIGDLGLVASLTNREHLARDMHVDLAELNLAGDDTVAATDLWTGRRIQAAHGALTIRVGGGDTVLLRIG